MTEMLMDMQILYHQLDQIGLSKRYIQQQILPDWWDNEFEQSNGAVATAAAYLSRRLSLNFESLIQRDRQPEFEQVYQAKFKLKKGTNSEKLILPYVIAIRIAELVAYACPNPYLEIMESSASKIREDILEKQHEINLKSVIAWCWQQGIPVIHLSNYPPKVNKFEGMIVWYNNADEKEKNRPVVIIGQNNKFCSKLLFILAHELGHWFKGHLNQDSFLLDEVINDNQDDAEEAEANEFSVELLTGNPYTEYQFPKSTTGDKLVHYAHQEKENNPTVSLGVIANNHGWRMKTVEGVNRWGVVNAALKIIEGDTKASQFINQVLQQSLDWERLSEDNQDYLRESFGLE
ncbi:MAG: ImmA/IrrE family metallo-endopeptidase [Spirulinaceae cyanobacterium]